MNDEEYIQLIQAYSLSQLEDALSHVDRDKFPQRVGLLEARIAERRKAGEAIEQEAMSRLRAESVSWGAALVVGWAFAWRKLLASLPLYFVVMIPLGFLSRRRVISPGQLALLLQSAFFVIGAAVGMAVMRAVLSKKRLGDVVIFVLEKNRLQPLPPRYGSPVADPPPGKA